MCQPFLLMFFHKNGRRLLCTWNHLVEENENDNKFLLHKKIIIIHGREGMLKSGAMGDYEIMIMSIDRWH